MPRKILLSFLGNNKYKPCCYTSHHFNSGVVYFVQEALIQLHCKDWTKEDKVVIFLTQDAKVKNWEGANYENGNGLQKALQKFDHLHIETIENLPLGFDESQIWQLFQILYQSIEPGDQVYLDITNAFRSLPMLQMVLLDYAKALKNIEVKQINYGAFETLGPIYQMEEKYPDPNDRLVPILDLTSFSALQDWTKAALDFKSYGKISRLQEILNTSLQPVLHNPEKRERTSQLLQEVFLLLQQLIPLLNTNRGKELQDFPFDQLNEKLKQFSARDNHIQPLTGIIEELVHKMAHFHSEDPMLWLKTAKWCLDHDLIQQGITQLQEGFVNYCCLFFKKKYDNKFFSPFRSRANALINSAFTFALRDVPEEKWEGPARKQLQLTRQVMKDPLVTSTKYLFIKIKRLRNDIQHGGYTNNTPPESFSRKLKEYIDRMERILHKKVTGIDDLTTVTGLLNFSNHSSEKWSAEQLAAASSYGEIMDMPFPAIDPNVDEEGLLEMVDIYLEDIIAQQPAAVHLMGEMTFTYALVSQLKKVGIPCIAATTHRMVEEVDGKKITEFKFVKFRNYY